MVHFPSLRHCLKDDCFYLSIQYIYTYTYIILTVLNGAQSQLCTMLKVATKFQFRRNLDLCHAPTTSKMSEVKGFLLSHNVYISYTMCIWIMSKLITFSVKCTSEHIIIRHTWILYICICVICYCWKICLMNIE